MHVCVCMPPEKFEFNEYTHAIKSILSVASQCTVSESLREVSTEISNGSTVSKHLLLYRLCRNNTNPALSISLALSAYVRRNYEREKKSIFALKPINQTHTIRVQNCSKLLCTFCSITRTHLSTYPSCQSLEDKYKV